MVEYMLRYMLDLRDRTEWTPYEAQKGCSNWQTDMCAGTGLMMMALPDFPNRHTWLNNADMILKAQLELNVNPDSSWPESIRYHHAALERFAGYAKAVDNVMGENWFETTPLARMFGYSIEMQTPGYAFFEGRVGTPPFGDHALGGGGEFGYFATYLTDIAKMDRDLADRMHVPPGAASGSPSRGCGEKASFWRILWAKGIPTFRLSLLHFVRPEIIRMRAFIFSGKTPGRETRATSPSCRVPSLSPTAIWTKAPSFCIRIPSRW